ncbi:MAG: lysine--tRNA ligase [Candidatus Wallbacteria bacterium HGW-Wallbacteria-1]|jgi:lysyl-tRNA synthetase class 2|uniref:Lysine--tRNA ligase n=1 Tax=Candidatus Wallbacteria bacterium HGW-Wallbacteria-1 TaxID=2013854 RepID=A0A2N1PTK4_9BACT|nr:MAG: lysine--tRNA ligase [Candidatus Wallbacteria bacterium HGW-Wallbacteria-1]
MPEHLPSDSEIIQLKYQKLEELKQDGVDTYPARFERRDLAADFVGRFSDIADGEVLEEPEFTVAGRVMAMRGMGKASFMDIEDPSGRMQVYVRRDKVAEEQFVIFRKCDVGDILGFTGTPFKTRTGELSLLASSVTLLSKSIRPLPEKWHGLKDVETRYRQRYVDLIANSEVKKTFQTRSLILRRIREYLDSRNFLEVETPMMHPIPGGAAAKPFITHHNTLDMQLYLRIAPELYLKRLIVGGMDRVYEINRNFRNEGISIKHNPEFTMLELYQSYTDYNGMMEITEGIVKHVVESLGLGPVVTFGENQIDLSGSFQRMTMLESIRKYTGVSMDWSVTREEAESAAKSLGVHVNKNWGTGKIVNEIFEAKVEDKLISPTFITDYPQEISPLSKNRTDYPQWVERFEFFMNGWEMANAFSELNDPVEQYQRFLGQVNARTGGDDEAHMMDEDYINALEFGMPPTGGMGMGIDRLVMILTGSTSIRDVILFPLLRKKED